MTIFHLFHFELAIVLTLELLSFAGLGLALGLALCYLNMPKHGEYNLDSSLKLP
jgi:hypothetical protein